MDKESKYIWLGRIASTVAVLMYVSYIAQIIANLNGAKGSPIQPMIAAINATLWTAYAWSTPKKNWPIFIANFPGIFLGIATAVTCL